MIKYEKPADTSEKEYGIQIKTGQRVYDFLYRDIERENHYFPYFDGYYRNPKYPQFNLQKVFLFCKPDKPPFDEWFELLNLATRRK